MIPRFHHSLASWAVSIIQGLLILATVGLSAHGQTVPTATVTTLVRLDASGIAVDSSGNVFAADYHNQICKVSPSGAVITLAGSGSAGSADGLGTAATFNQPSGIAVDSAGAVYVADSANHRIRKIDPTGIVTTLAGSGTAGSADGIGTAAQFDLPQGLTVDSSGRVYVADTFNHRIRAIDPSGMVTTIAGTGSVGSTDGTGTIASFRFPSGLALDAAGDLYVADSANNTVRKIMPNGLTTTVAGNGSFGSVDGMGTAAGFQYPIGVSIDSLGNVYVADEGGNKIRKITPNGMVATLAGSGSYGLTDGNGSAAGFSLPMSVASDAQGNVYVADGPSNKLQQVSSGGVVTTLATSEGSGLMDGDGTAACFILPRGLAVDGAGLVYVADAGNSRIGRITQPTPVISWTAPVAITDDTPLSSVQLDATANVPGTFAYSPAAGAVLSAGSRTLTVTFTPSDTMTYAIASASQTLTVLPGNYAFLEQLFPLVLGRPVDPEALSAYAAAMSGGLTRSQVYGELLESAEFSAWKIEPVIRLYFAALARTPDYNGLQTWSNALRAGVFTLTGAADQFAISAEFISRYGSLDNAGFVQQLYGNVLGRKADAAGLAGWVGLLDRGASRGTVLVGFSESDEFKAMIAHQVEIVRLFYLLKERMPTATELQSWSAFLNGDSQTDSLVAQGYPAGLADSDYVRAAFNGFLCRDADTEALDAFTAGLAAGTISHGSLVDAILNSVEFNACVAPVSRLYLAAFQRVPDQSGLFNWVNYARAGSSLDSVAATFAASQEFTDRYAASNDTDYVNQLYQNVLGRAPDSAGLAYWVGLLSAGSTRGQVLAGIAQSQEGIALLAPTLRTYLSYYAFLDTAVDLPDLDHWRNYLDTLTEQFRGSFLGSLGSGG